MISPPEKETTLATSLSHQRSWTGRLHRARKRSHKLNDSIYMGWDPEVWEDPMQLKTERFLSIVDIDGRFDIKGRWEIRVMPFVVGRRICSTSASWYVTMVFLSSYSICLNSPLDFIINIQHLLSPTLTLIIHSCTFYPAYDFSHQKLTAVYWKKDKTEAKRGE